MNKIPIVILTGPTAVGKTALSIQLAKAINGEIVSADSMQVYRHMDIGSAKITEKERDDIPHHLLDILEPWENFDVVRFQALARSACFSIHERGKIPIITGGTGFYIQALLYDIDFTHNEENTTYRQELTELAQKKGNILLHEMLQEIDPEAAKSIHANNVRRVIRALEFYKLSGERISEHNEKEKQKDSPYEFCYFVLNEERTKLYNKIDQRVMQMFDNGLLDEVKWLKENGCQKDFVSMQGLGYKEVLDYLDNKCTLEETIYNIKKETRHFAKRQLTWFRREKDIIWINKEDFEENEQKILTFMIDKIKAVLINE